MCVNICEPVSLHRSPPRCDRAHQIPRIYSQYPHNLSIQHHTTMPLREWAKKHLPKKKPKEDDESTDSEKETPPTSPPGGGLKIYRSDTQGITPLQIPDVG